MNAPLAPNNRHRCTGQDDPSAPVTIGAIATTDAMLWDNLEGEGGKEQERGEIHHNNTNNNTVVNQCFKYFE